jgi:hypothetical protein
VAAQGGYLSQYSEEINTETLSGSAIIELVSGNYSVNPRLLLALLEHRSHWVTQAEPGPAHPDYPLGFIHPNRVGLYRQLAWAANELNRGYYLWRANAVGTWVLNDGTVIPIDPTINAGTAAVHRFFRLTIGDMGGRERTDSSRPTSSCLKSLIYRAASPGRTSAADARSVRGGGTVGVHRRTSRRLGLGLGLGCFRLRRARRNGMRH